LDESKSHAFQLDLMGGWMGQFDLDNEQDVIGWDGLYGYFITYSNGRGFAAQLGVKHRSCHMGDEYIERTGAVRLGYSRGEYVLGLSLEGLNYFRVYAEGGYADYILNSVLQERFQVNVELLNPFRNIRYNESDFDPDWINKNAPAMTVAVGLAIRTVGG